MSAERKPAVRVFETDWGPFAIGATAKGAARVILPNPKGEAQRGSLSHRAAHDAPADARGHAALAEREIRAYLAGRLRTFTVPLDLADLTAFQRAVLEGQCRVPYGRTGTYGDLAARIGRPKAARAVGGALGRNPVPLLVPCHRTVAAGGGLGGFGGGLALKRRLLALESGE